jgi:hypothetical protein
MFILLECDAKIGFPGSADCNISHKKEKHDYSLPVKEMA